MEPISPNEIGKHQRNVIPSFVFEIVNTLISVNYSDGQAIVRQEDIILEILKYDLSTQNILDRKAIFDKGYLNFEEAYRDKGWKVEYDKPAYNESYAATFKFTKK